MPGIRFPVKKCRLLLPLAALIASWVGSGCGSMSKGLSVFSPYRAAAQPEEFHSPPPQDSRFTEPPTYPSHLLKPVYKPKESSQENMRKAFGAGAPGGMGGY